MIKKAPNTLGEHRRSIKFMRAARIGFRAILESMDFSARDTILMPAYIGITDREGSGVMDPVEAVQARMEFYPVDDRLSGDLEFIEKCLSSGRIKALLVIHYFGIAQNNMKRMRELCAQHEVVLIEDCAHAWRSSLENVPLGTYGDYSFGSIHKYLAAPDGGFAIWNEGLQLKCTLSSEEEISREALIDFASADYSAIADVRLQNYQHLTGQLHKVEGIDLMYPELDSGIIPLNFPILVTGMPREKLYFELIDRGFTLIALYYRLIPQIDAEQFPISHHVSNSILNLPVHQDTSVDELDQLIDAMKDILDSEVE